MHIVLADDHVMLREGLRAFLQRLGPDITILEGGSLPDVMAVLSTAPEPIRLVLLDLKMPGMDGIEGIKRVKAVLPEVPVVILSSVVDRAQMVEAINAGASGYIPKKLSGNAMLSALQLVLSGERFVPYLVGPDDGPARSVSEPAQPSNCPPLTRREREILTLLKDGHPNKIIASKLDVSEVTVKSHLCSIFRKMGVQNRVQAIRRFVDAEAH